MIVVVAGSNLKMGSPDAYPAAISEPLIVTLEPMPSFRRNPSRWLSSGYRRTDKFAFIVGTVLVGSLIAIVSGIAFLRWGHLIAPAPAVAQIVVSQDPVGRLRPRGHSADLTDPIRFIIGDNLVDFPAKEGLLVPILSGGRPLVWVDYDPILGAALSADFYFPDGRLAAQFRGNAFTLNQNFAYSVKPRIDASGLTVLDSDGHVVLNVEFLAERLFYIEGHFQTQDHGQVSISADKITSDRGTVIHGIHFVGGGFGI